MSSIGTAEYLANRKDVIVFLLILHTPKPLYNTVVGVQAETMLDNQLYYRYIQTKMYKLYRKMTIYSHFSK